MVEVLAQEPTGKITLDGLPVVEHRWVRFGTPGDPTTYIVHYFTGGAMLRIVPNAHEAKEIEAFAPGAWLRVRSDQQGFM